MRTRKHTSSGGVVYSVKEGRLQVILISHHNLKGRLIWCLPKGSVEKGETLTETALREVREETGIRGRILEKIGHIQYWFYSKHEEIKIFKTVHFYLLKYLDGSVEDHDGEVDEARWVSVQEGLSMLSHRSERSILEKAGRYLTALSETDAPSAKPQNASGSSGCI
ncbi:MAG: NUDIX hydrolase [Nitrospiria bacterium]